MPGEGAARPHRYLAGVEGQVLKGVHCHQNVADVGLRQGKGKAHGTESAGRKRGQRERAATSAEEREREKGTHVDLVLLVAALELFEENVVIQVGQGRQVVDVALDPGLGPGLGGPWGCRHDGWLLVAVAAARCVCVCA